MFFNNSKRWILQVIFVIRKFATHSMKVWFQSMLRYLRKSYGTAVKRFTYTLILKSKTRDEFIFNENAYYYYFIKDCG